MNLIALPAFTDNTIWLLHDGRDALVVDPQGPQLAGILVTHCHEVPAVVQTARTRDAVHGSPVAVFAALRSWKNEFR